MDHAHDPSDSGPSRQRPAGVVHRLPQHLRASELPLGWEVEPRRQVGFARATKARPDAAHKRFVAWAGDEHVMTVARTGAGKGRGCTIPWLLHVHNPAIVLDVKGEAYHCTAKWRREALGHRIVLLDPFERYGGTDALNPFDLIRKDHVDTDADVLAELFVDGQPVSTKEPFWDNVARAFLLGCIAHVATAAAKATPTALRDLLQADDVPLRIATMLDKKTVVSELAKREFVTFLNHESDKVRTSVLSTAQQHLRTLAAASVARALDRSTISLDDVVRGEDFTIYLTIPPENLLSHGSVLRLWVGTLLHAVTRRRRRPRLNTMFFLDEIAQCGTMPALRSAITLLRGYGMTTLTFWQDLAQLQKYYDDWRTLLNNCAVVQAFGASTYEMAKTMGDILGFVPDALRSLPSEHSMVSVAGGEPFVVRRLDYLRDRPFKQRASPNPWFEQRFDDDGDLPPRR